MPKNKISPRPEDLDFVDDSAAALLLTTPRAARFLLWVCFLFVGCALMWAAWAELDEVTVGQGKVIPSLQLQVVQNLEGGILKEVFVHEGDMVEKGQALLRIDDTLFRSDYREQESKLNKLKGDVSRFRAELASLILDPSLPIGQWRQQVSIDTQQAVFPSGFKKLFPKEVASQEDEMTARLSSLENQLAITARQIEQRYQDLLELNSNIHHLERSYALVTEELAITQPLADEGVVSQVELLQLKRQANELLGDIESHKLSKPKAESALRETISKRREMALDFQAETQESLNESLSELDQLAEGQVGLKDRVERTLVTAPLKGTVKKIYINTIGGIIQPGMSMMDIVPSEDNLIVEAMVAPKDIAFLRPGLEAVVKFSAYDFAIYGGLEGVLEHISADTILDEEGNSFYFVRVRTKQTFIDSHQANLEIIPGMLASVDIVTGKKSVLDYLLKPILRAKYNALRER